MLAGYILEHIVGIILILTAVCSFPTMNRWRLRVIERATIVFHDCAVFFAFSVEIAATILLLREETGISTSGMGDATVRITQAVSLLVLLPTAYLFLLNAYVEHGRSGCEHSTRDKHRARQIVELKSVNRLPIEALEDKEASKPQRLVFAVLVWLLSFWPFYSSVYTLAGPSKIGSEPNSAITPGQFQEIQNMCLSGIHDISPAEIAAMAAFEIFGYLFFSLLVLGRIIWLGVAKHHQQLRPYLAARQWLASKTGQRSVLVINVVCMALIPMTACGLLWTVFRTRQLQMDMATKVGGVDTDGQWTFGQIIAVTVFVPVVLELWNACREEQCRGQDTA
jgi:hypothetical protein